MINKELYSQAVDLIEEYGDVIETQDLGIIVNGAELDTLAVEYWGLVPKIKFYVGNPFSEEDEYFEELILTDEQINGVLEQVLDEF